MMNQEALKIVFLIYAPDFSGSYYILHCFETDHFYDCDYLENFYRSQFNKAPNFTKFPHTGPFEDFAGLKNFSFLLCKEASADRIVLLTLEDFQVALDKNSQKADLCRHLAGLGESLENLNQEGQGFFSKIFRS